MELPGSRPKSARLVLVGQAPLVLYVATTAAVALYLGSFTVASLVLATLLVVSGVALSVWQARRERVRCDAHDAAVEQLAAEAVRDREGYTRELERLNIEICPILSRHVAASRDLAESNVASLSARFAAMVDQLGRVVDSSESTRLQREFEGFLDNSQHSLQEVVDSLRTLLQRESAMVERVKGLSDDIGTLDAMAASVRSVADQINVLALNAAIEAARAGEYGRGFAVVADEVRKLAATSASAGEQISNKIAGISDAMAQTLGLVETSSELDDRAIDSSQQTISEVLAGMHGLMGGMRVETGSLIDSSEQLRAEINEVLVSLQFQDRLNQILQHVQSSLDEMERTLRAVQAHDGQSRQQDMLQVDDLLQRMLAEYTTHEEKQRHGADRPLPASTAAPDLTFF